LKKSILLTLILAVIAFTSVGMWGDLARAGPELRRFTWYLIPAIALFGFGNDMIKFLRWQVYLRKLGIDIPMARSLGVFISGLSMSATPGKVGFLLKSQMLKVVSKRGFISVSPVVISELYMDLIGLSIVSLVGIGFMSKGVWITLVICMIPLLGLVPGIAEFMVSIIARLPYMSSRASELESALKDMFRLFGPGVLMVSLAITLVAWTSEGMALKLILKGLGFEIGLVKATSIFGFSTLIGALSFLPGGLVVTDASLMGLIIHAGIPRGTSAIACIMARLSTLWLSVFIGSLYLVFNKGYILQDRGGGVDEKE